MERIRLGAIAELARVFSVWSSASRFCASIRLGPRSCSIWIDNIRAASARRIAEPLVDRVEERGDARGDRLVRQEPVGDVARLLVRRRHAEDLHDVREGALDLAELAGVEHEELLGLGERVGGLLARGFGAYCGPIENGTVREAVGEVRLLEEALEVLVPARRRVTLGERVAARPRRSGSRRTMS